VTVDLRDIMPVPLHYDCEPEQNIALARNRAMAHATGNFIAFIDDDEVPKQNWLVSLYEACHMFRADGVLGPVLPSYETEPPSWVVRGKFYERPSHETGELLTWKNTRTGNVLFRRTLLLDDDDWFRTEFGSGGEDRDFFKRMIAKGHQFVWCAEAPVLESVPAERCTRYFMIRRAFLRGQLPHFKGIDLLKSLVAVPVYSSLLPMLLSTCS
jgi:glycosyltransferase involved in cell wall biosynthesis